MVDMVDVLKTGGPAPVLTARGISKSFHGVKVLHSVEITLRPGEVHALMGENGAGKSTLIKILTGVLPKDGGEIQLSDRAIAPSSSLEAQNLGISTVYQEVNLIPTLSVAENIFLGREQRRWGRIDWKAIYRGAERALSRLHLDIDVRRPLEDYSIAIQQMTAIARALDLDARILILDEATSSLDAGETEELFAVLRRLKSKGLSILFITHFLDQVYAACDRITILRNGANVGEFKASELPRVQLVAKMMGQELHAVAQEQEALAPENVRNLGKAWLECEGLGMGEEVKPTDLKIHEGETLGVAGLLGSGRTELARLIFGLDTADQGSLKIDGQAVRFQNPRQAISAGFALCPDDRKAHGIFPELSVRENIVLALQAHRGWFRYLSYRKQNEIASRYIKALRIKARDAEQPIQTLSGGNQQKAILARWLAMNPRLLILDEPTRGIDVGAKAEIEKLISELAASGKSILFISSELEEIVRCCDRVAVLKDRRKIGELHGEQLSDKKIMEVIASGGLP